MTVLAALWITMVVFGAALSAWAELALPEGTDMRPIPPVKEVRDGPYGLLKHPMYVGNVAVLAGFAGLGGGIFAALSVGILAKMIMQHFAGLERG